MSSSPDKGPIFNIQAIMWEVVPMCLEACIESFMFLKSSQQEHIIVTDSLMTQPTS